MQIIDTIYTSTLLGFLVDISIKSFIVFLIGWIVACYFRQKSAAIRSYVWGLTLIGCLTVPLFSLILPKWDIGILPNAQVDNDRIPLTATTQHSDTSVFLPTNQTSIESVLSTHATSVQEQPEIETRKDSFLTTSHWSTWIWIVWLCVSGFFIGQLIFGICAIWHFSIRAEEFKSAKYQIPSAVKYKYSIRLSDRITIPMVWGFMRPVILLPVDSVNWNSERLEAVILHETAHIKRCDWLMQTIARITCAFYWFNPFVWFASHRMRMEAEQACDDQVLNAGYQSTDYAQHLLAIVRNVKSVVTSSHAAVTMVSNSSIEGRLKTILTDSLNRHPMKRVAVGIGLLILICFAASISILRLTNADSTEVAQHQQHQGHSGLQSTPELFPPRPAVEGEETDHSQNIKNLEICKHNLETIGKALQNYKKDNGDFPNWLSDLYPDYIDDPEVLLCPSDKIGGKPIFYTNTDPKMPVSYGYQFHPGLRITTQENRDVYGDVIPFVRCRHHEDQPFECINLNFAFKIYTSQGTWQITPEDMYDSIEEAITALELGIQSQPDHYRFNSVYLNLLRLYLEVGREDDVDDLINNFETSIDPVDIDAHFFLSELLETANQHNRIPAIFEKLEKRYPNSSLVLNKLVEIHEELGNTQLADTYRKKMDPMIDLVGKITPDFSVTDINGKPISLHHHKGKVVLLHFWAVWSRHCITEMPNVKRIYNTYKDDGFEIIGVSLDTDETRLRNYLKVNDINWHQIFSGQKWNSPLVKKYHIDGIPTSWLIAKDGTLISRSARGMKLEALVVEQLKQKTENE